jgi:hypothetical protein
MALGDFGGGLIAGIQGVQQMSQQRRDNEARTRQMDQTDRSLRLSEYELELSRDRLAENKRQFEVTSKQTDRGLDIDEKNADTSSRLASVSEGNLKIAQAGEERTAQDYALVQDKKAIAKLVNTAGKLGFVNTSNPSKLDEVALAGQLQLGDRNASNIALTILNKGSLPRPEGFEYTEIRQVNGKLAVLGKYEDGRQGVLTANGSIDPDDEVVLLDPKTAAGLISDEYVNFEVMEAIKGDAGAEFLAMTGVNDADMQAARAQAKVTTTIDAQANPAASRSFRRVLAAAGSEEEKRQIIRQTAEDLGIDVPEVNVVPGTKIVEYQRPTRSNFGNNPVTAEEATGTPSYESDLAKIDRKIAKRQKAIDDNKLTGENLQREQSILTDLEAERYEIVDATNRENLALVDQEIADLESKRDKARGPRKEYWQGLIDEKNAKRDELRTALGDITPVMQTEAWSQLEAQVIDRVDGMTPEEIDVAVDSGELTLTVDQINTMSQRLQEAGVKTIADIAKLPTKEQLASRALLAVVAPDVSARDQARKELANLRETGTTSYSRAGLDAAAVDRTKADASLTNARANLANANTNFGNLQRNLGKDDREEYGEALDTANQAFDAMEKHFFPDGGATLTEDYGTAISNFNRDFGRMILARGKIKNPEARAVVDAGINASISTAVAAFVQSGPSSSIGASMKAFFLDDVNAQSGDFSLDRVRVDDPQNPTELIYLSYATDASGARTGEQQGARIKISDLEKVSKRVADYVKKTAVANTANVQ